MPEPIQPEPWLGDDGLVRVRCGGPTVRDVSNVVGDKPQTVVWIGELCDVAGLEYDDAELPDKIVISIPPGS